MKTVLTSIAFILFSTSLALAHGNHDSGHVKPQRGGILRSLETIHVELVQINKEVRIYVYNKDVPPKVLKTKDFPVSAKVILPRGKGSEEVSLKDKEDHWTTQYDAKDLHRYTFEFSIEQGGHKDKLSFTIEPKK